MNIKPSLFITEEIIDAVLWVNTLFRGWVTFCGSLGLVMNGKLARPVHDVDCITDHCWYGAFFEQIGQYGLDTSNSEKFTVNGVLVCVFKLIAPNGINVDVMYRQDGCKGRANWITMNGRSAMVRIEDPESAIEIKRNYLKIADRTPNPESVAKHTADLEYIDALENRKRS